MVAEGKAYTTNTMGGQFKLEEKLPETRARYPRGPWGQDERLERLASEGARMVSSSPWKTGR